MVGEVPRFRGAVVLRLAVGWPAADPPGSLGVEAGVVLLHWQAVDLPRSLADRLAADHPEHWDLP